MLQSAQKAISWAYHGDLGASSLAVGLVWVCPVATRDMAIDQEI
jgi:hypothetical protein